MKNSGIDVVRNVWHAEYEPLVVAPSTDCPGYVTLKAADKEGRLFYGLPGDGLTVPAEMAAALAEAIGACAREQIAAKESQ